MQKETRILFLIFVLLAAVAAAQEKPSRLTVVGRDGKQTEFSGEQLRKMPRQVVAVTDPHANASHQYEGVLLSSLLSQVGTPSGEALQGAEVRDYVEATGEDNYKVIFALVELDSMFPGQQSYCCRYDGRQAATTRPWPVTTSRSSGSASRALGPHVNHGQRTPGTLRPGLAKTLKSRVRLLRTFSAQTDHLQPLPPGPNFVPTGSRNRKVVKGWYVGLDVKQRRAVEHVDIANAQLMAVDSQQADGGHADLVRSSR